jgi:very-short-patch-repair endonuclease
MKICKSCAKIYTDKYRKSGGTRIKLMCQQCGNEFYCPPSTANKPNKKYCSIECRAKASIGMNIGEKSPRWKEKVIKKCENCGKEMEVIPSLAGRRRFCSRHCLGVWIYEKNGVLTEPEKVLNYVLLSHGIEFETHKTIGTYNVDFAIKNTNIVIEVDGYYWHSLKKHKISDPLKDKALFDMGYKIIRIPEMDIYNDMRKCVLKILKLLEGD